MVKTMLLLEPWGGHRRHNVVAASCTVVSVARMTMSMAMVIIVVVVVVVVVVITTSTSTSLNTSTGECVKTIKVAEQGLFR